MKYEFVPGDEITIAPGRTVKRIRHGMRHSPEYGVWCGIIQRCTERKRRSGLETVNAATRCGSDSQESQNMKPFNEWPDV